MLKAIEKYWGALSSIAFSICLVLILLVNPEWVETGIQWIQQSPQGLQTTILVLAIVTAWAGFKEFVG